MAEIVRHISIHHNAPSRACRSFAVITAFGKCVPVNVSEYTEWLLLHFEPPIIRIWKKKRFIKKLEKKKGGSNE